MIRKTLALIIPTLFVAGSAQATFVAGWDFSQYAGPGAPTIDGGSLASQVPSNYSDFDPTFGAGSQSDYGTMYLDGTNGSTPGGGSLLVPTSDALTLLQALPQNGDPVGDVPFDSFTVLNAEGQVFETDVSMLASSAVTAVFGVDLFAGKADSYSIDFAGVALSGAPTIGISISTDGVTFNPFTTVNLGTTEQAYNVDFAGSILDNSSTAFVALAFQPNAVIDNLGISGVNATLVPEPGTGVLLALGLSGLAYRGRRKV